MKILKFAQCPICDKILAKQLSNGKFFYFPNYKTFWTRLNDNSKMEIVICNKCLIGLDIKKINNIMDKIIYTWNVELGNKKDNKIIKEKERIKKLKIIKFNILENNI